MWDLSSPTRDRTWALTSESKESQPLDCQGIPRSLLFQTVLQQASGPPDVFPGGNAGLKDEYN